MLVRELSTGEYDLALQIADLQPKTGGADKQSTDKLKVWMTEKQDGKTMFLGCFDDTGLVSWAAVRHGELHGEKVWSFLLLYTSRFYPVFSWKPPELGLLIRESFAIAEAKEYYAYIYSIASRVSNVYERTWTRNPWVPPGRYELHSLGVVPKNTVPVESWKARLTAAPQGHDIEIKKRTLRDDLRHPGGILQRAS